MVSPFSKRMLFFIGILALALCAGCMGPKTVDNAQKMTVEFEWVGFGCSLSSPNPELRVGNVPSGTAYLKVAMDDLDSPGFNHGGGTVAYTGDGKVAAGALTGYKGPCPPTGNAHLYRFRVTALNADKSLILGEGMMMKRYP